MKEDLKWVWDKLQGKPSTEQKILDSLREQHRIVASLELEHEYQQVKDSEYNQVEKNDEKMNDKPTSTAYRLARSKELHEERVRLKMKQAIESDIRRLMRQAIDEEDGQINLVETKESKRNNILSDFSFR